MLVVSVINQKGGVGKTTTTVNLGAALASLGRRVLLIDLDPQANLSTHLGIDLNGAHPTIYDVLVSQRPMEEAVLATEEEGLSCVPANLDLSAAEMELVAMVGRETLLRDALAEIDARFPNRFDTVLLDCPPSLGVLTVNALAAADEVLVPLQTEFFALQGMAKLIEVIELVRRRLNPKVCLKGIVACKVDQRPRLTTEVLDEVKRYFADRLFRTMIRPNVKLAEAPSFGKSVLAYAPDSNGAWDYLELAREYLGMPLEADAEEEWEEDEDEEWEEDEDDEEIDESEELAAEPDASSEPSIDVAAEAPSEPSGTAPAMSSDVNDVSDIAAGSQTSAESPENPAIETSREATPVDAAGSATDDVAPSAASPVPAPSSETSGSVTGPRSSLVSFSDADALSRAPESTEGTDATEHLLRSEPEDLEPTRLETSERISADAIPAEPLRSDALTEPLTAATEPPISAAASEPMSGVTESQGASDATGSTSEVLAGPPLSGNDVRPLLGAPSSVPRPPVFDASGNESPGVAVAEHVSPRPTTAPAVQHTGGGWRGTPRGAAAENRPIASRWNLVLEPHDDQTEIPDEEVESDRPMPGVPSTSQDASQKEPLEGPVAGPPGVTAYYRVAPVVDGGSPPDAVSEARPLPPSGQALALRSDNPALTSETRRPESPSDLRATGPRGFEPLRRTVRAEIGSVVPRHPHEFREGTGERSHEAGQD